MTDQKKRLIIIDSHALIHRAFHAIPPFTTSKGELVNSVYGFLSIFFKILKELEPDFVAACFDLPAPTFRHKKFKKYKANRHKTPKELSSQIPRVKEILKVFRVGIFEKEGYEADDLIGTISKLAQIPHQKHNVEPEIESIIISGDLDTLQLIDDHTKVYTSRRGIKDILIYDKEKVEERYGGLTPEQMSDFKGLKGDPSDNIPGVLGIGEKTAIQLIGDFGSLENLYKELEEKSEKAEKLKDSLKEKLLNSKEIAFLSKTLTQIKIDVPLEFDLKKCRWGEYDKEKVYQILKELGFHSLIKRLPELP